MRQNTKMYSRKDENDTWINTEFKYEKQTIMIINNNNKLVRSND